MKRLLLIAIALITVNATAQQKREGHRKVRMERSQHFKDFTPEQIATLQTKKMTLQLDLSEAQQKDIKAIHLEQAKARRAAMDARKKMNEEGKEVKPTKEDLYNKANAQLDKKLATKAKMKRVLSKEQYEKWEHNNSKRGKQRTMIRNKENHKKMTRNRKHRH